MATKLDVYQKLEQAKKIENDAEEQVKKIQEAAKERAKQIKKDCLSDLREERKEIAAKLALIDKEIASITGMPTTATSGKSRVDTEATIIEILTAHPGITCNAIETHPKMLALYATKGKTKASPQAIKLKSMVKEGKLVKTGELKKAVYSIKK